MGLVDEPAGFPPATRVAAAILIGIETAAELVFVAGRSDHAVPSPRLPEHMARPGTGDE
jgi:hypothetical protein